MRFVPELTGFATGLLGVGIFHLAGLPLPWLLGPIFSCLFAALFGVRIRGVPLLNGSMRTILGVAVGATITPAVLVSFALMWPTLMLVPVMVLCAGLVGVPYFQKVWGYDFPTSYYSAMPGGLQDMLVFGEEAGGNVRSLSLIQATRVTVIVVALPFVLQSFWQADLTRPPGAPLVSLNLSEIAVMGICAALGWWGAHRIGLFGASILGPLIVSAGASLLGLLENRPPAEAIWAAQFFIGMTVGAKYTGITMFEVRRDLAAGFGYCLVLFAISGVFLGAIRWFDLAPGLESVLSFAPGGQAEMAILALIAGADMAFVVAHHVFRIIVVIVGAPLAARLFFNDSK